MTTKPRTTRRRKKELDPRWIIAGSVVIIGLALVLIYVTRDTSASSAQPVVNPPAPEFSLASLDGTVSLSDFRGQYVLVNFWASWCPPCMREMPDLYAYHLAHRDSGFTLLAVNVNEDAATVDEFVRANNFDFPVALDTTGVVFQRFGGDGLPSSFLIGPDGSLVKTWRPGAITRAMLEQDVTPLLNG